MNLPHSLTRAIVIQAPRETVFRYFTDSARFAKWWGAGSTIEGAVGGAVYIRYPNGVEVKGEVLEVEPPARIVFTYGYASGQPIAVGASRVTIELEEHPLGTELKLRHEFAEASARDLHVQGWRFQLSVFANVASDEVQVGAGALVDAWIAAWSMADAAEREKVLREIVSPQIVFQDRYSWLSGMEDLLEHIGASLRFMPGIQLERRGKLRHCQGTGLVDWAMVAGGEEKMTGTNVFRFDAKGRIAAVTGVANT